MSRNGKRLGIAHARRHAPVVPLRGRCGRVADAWPSLHRAEAALCSPRLWPSR
jgi:hypothetical protein